MLSLPADLSAVLEDPANSLAELLTEIEICTDPRDPRVTSKPVGLEGISEINDTWESARAGDLNPIVEYLDPDMIANHAV